MKRSKISQNIYIWKNLIDIITQPDELGKINNIVDTLKKKT